MPSLLNRLVRDSDLEEIYGIYMHEATIPYLGVDAMSKDEFRPIFRDLMARGRFLAFESGGRIGGFINIVRLKGRCRHIVQLGPIAVRADLHGSGFARLMLAAVLDELLLDGIRRVELLVEKDNPRAIWFYRRMGFDVEGTLRGAYRRAYEDADVDSYLMAKLYA